MTCVLEGSSHLIFMVGGGGGGGGGGLEEVFMPRHFFTHDAVLSFYLYTHCNTIRTTEFTLSYYYFFSSKIRYWNLKKKKPRGPMVL